MIRDRDVACDVPGFLGPVEISAENVSQPEFAQRANCGLTIQTECRLERQAIRRMSGCAGWLAVKFCTAAQHRFGCAPLRAGCLTYTALLQVLPHCRGAKTPCTPTCQGLFEMANSLNIEKEEIPITKLL